MTQAQHRMMLLLAQTIEARRNLEMATNTTTVNWANCLSDLVKEADQKRNTEAIMEYCRIKREFEAACDVVHNERSGSS